jgi:hypothetical protein
MRLTVVVLIVGLPFSLFFLVGSVVLVVRDLLRYKKSGSQAAPRVI